MIKHHIRSLPFRSHHRSRAHHRHLAALMGHRAGALRRSPDRHRSAKYLTLRTIGPALWAFGKPGLETLSDFFKILLHTTHHGLHRLPLFGRQIFDTILEYDVHGAFRRVHRLKSTQFSGIFPAALSTGRSAQHSGLGCPIHRIRHDLAGVHVGLLR